MYPNYEKLHYNLGLIYFNVEKDFIKAKEEFYEGYNTTKP